MKYSISSVEQMIKNNELPKATVDNSRNLFNLTGLLSVDSVEDTCCVKNYIDYWKMESYVVLSDKKGNFLGVFGWDTIYYARHSKIGEIKRQMYEDHKHYWNKNSINPYDESVEFIEL